MQVEDTCGQVHGRAAAACFAVEGVLGADPPGGVCHMYPQPHAPLIQKLHRQAVIHLCCGCVVYGDHLVMREVQAMPLVQVRRRSLQQRSCSLLLSYSQLRLAHEPRL